MILGQLVKIKANGLLVSARTPKANHSVFMAIVRIEKKERDFTQIHNSLLNDAAISFKAKGLLCYLLSKPNDWVISVQQIINQFSVTKDFVYGCFDELIKTGYAERKKITSAGKFVRTEYTITEFKKPCATFPLPENPDVVLPDTVFSDTTNTILTNTVFNKEEINKGNFKILDISINNWIKNNTKRVSKMPEQITVEQYEILKNSGKTSEEIIPVLKYMNNWNKLNNYVSVYDTLIFLIKNKQTA